MKKRKTPKAYTPSHLKPDDRIKLPTHYSKYVLFNPAFDVSIVYQLLQMRIKEPMFMMKGKPEDFADTPNEVFRIVNEAIDIKEGVTNGTDK